MSWTEEVKSQRLPMEQLVQLVLSQYHKASQLLQTFMLVALSVTAVHLSVQKFFLINLVL